MSLELKQISKIYGKKTVLNGLNLTLEEEKIYGLIGRNGAGFHCQCTKSGNRR